MLFLKRRPTSLCSRRLPSSFQDVPRPSFYFLEDYYPVKLTLSSFALAKRGLLCFRYFSYLSWTFQPNKVSWVISVDVSAELVYVLTDGAAVYWEVYRLHLKTFITQVTINWIRQTCQNWQSRWRFVVFTSVMAAYHWQIPWETLYTDCLDSHWPYQLITFLSGSPWIKLTMRCSFFHLFVI